MHPQPYPQADVHLVQDVKHHLQVNGLSLRPLGALLHAGVRAEYDAGTPTRDFVFGELHKYVSIKLNRADLREKYLGLSVEEIAKRENKHIISRLPMTCPLASGDGCRRRKATDGSWSTVA